MFKGNLLILYIVLHLTLALPSKTGKKEEMPIVTRGLFTSHVSVINACPQKGGIPSVRLGGTCFYFAYSLLGTWYTGLSYCRSNGLKLAKILSREEHNGIVSHINKIGQSNKSFWISGADLAREGDFSWFEYDQRIIYRKWQTNQPDDDKSKNSFGEDCIELAHEQSHLYNDQNCYELRSFLCELR